MWWVMFAIATLAGSFVLMLWGWFRRGRVAPPKRLPMSAPPALLRFVQTLGAVSPLSHVGLARGVAREAAWTGMAADDSGVRGFLLLIASALLLACGALLVPLLWLPCGGIVVLSLTVLACWLDTAKRRRRQFERGVPMLLDVLCGGLQSGRSFFASMQLAAQVLGGEPVGALPQYYLLSRNDGVPAGPALQALNLRFPLTCVQRLSSVARQAERTGADLASLLSEQASQLLRERVLAAEEMANKAPVKLLLPMVVCFFPMNLCLVLFPVAMRLMEAF